LRFNRIISGWEVGFLHYVKFLLDFFTLKFQKKALSKEVKKSIQEELLFIIQNEEKTSILSSSSLFPLCQISKTFFSWENFEKLIRKKIRQKYILS
jgi:hypothetical protein